MNSSIELNNKETTSKKVFFGLIWMYLERFLAQGISLLVSIVLARLLLPDDYGVIAIVQIFISIANVFVGDGFASALVQKKECKDIDYSTVTIFSVSYSLVLYAILFFAAPYIAAFYENPLIVPIIRVMAIRLPIAGINTVQRAIVSRKMIFRKFFFATLGGTIISAVIGIMLAYMGFGAWALVAQYLSNCVIDTIWLSVSLHWFPRFKFSFESLKSVVSYGWKLLATSILTTAYSQSRSIIISKRYTSADLAYVVKSEQFPNILSNNINTSISQVLFPALSSYQDDGERLKQISRRAVQISSFIIAPMLIGLASISEELISLLLTKRWIDCVPYMQIYCLIYLLQPIQTAALQCMKAVGRSDYNLKLQILKSAFGLLTVFITLLYFDSVSAIVTSALVTEIFATVLNLPIVQKLIGYSIFEQLLDAATPILLSGTMFTVVQSLPIGNFGIVFRMILKIAVGATIYIILSVIFQRKQINYFITLIRNNLNRR